jgi:hypothetical protein
MAKRTRKEAAFTRNATHHHQFIGEAQPERAEARSHEEERIEKDHAGFVVQEMARQLDAEAEKSKPVMNVRIPRSLNDGMNLLKEAAAPETRQRLREKAEERLASLPGPVAMAVWVVQRGYQGLLWPVQLGVRLAAGIVRTPAAMLRLILRRPKEA